METQSQLVLLAEDDEDFHLILKFALEEAGFRGTADTVQSGSELFEYLAKVAFPSFIILDFHPPNDWREILKHLKGDSRLKPIPVIVLCANALKETVDFCESFENCYCVKKPMEMGDWVSFMRDTLRKYSA